MKTIVGRLGADVEIEPPEQRNALEAHEDQPLHRRMPEVRRDPHRRHRLDRRQHRRDVEAVRERGRGHQPLDVDIAVGVRRSARERAP